MASTGFLWLQTYEAFWLHECVSELLGISILKLKSQQQLRSQSDCCHHKETCYAHQGSQEQQVCGLLLEEGDTQVMCCWRRVIHKSCAAGGG